MSTQASGQSGGREEGKKEPGHEVQPTSVVSDESVNAEFQAFQQHQRRAAKLSHADEARTLVANARTGVLSSLSCQPDTAGYPSGSVVEFAADDRGLPVFVFSTLSPHTSDVLRDSRCSLTVTSPTFKAMSDARVAITGKVTAVGPADRASARELYLSKNPNSFWIDFGDFSFYHMSELAAARLVGGFARAGKVTAEEYLTAKPDPVAIFSGPIAEHMNSDHAESTLAIIRQYVGLAVDRASFLNVDALGFNAECHKNGETFKCRVPFIRPATSREQVREVIVEMTRTAMASM